MTWPVRVTLPLLEVTAALVQADGLVHGWTLVKQADQLAPTYRALARLRNAGWITDEWEQRNPVHGKPARRLVRLTELGAAQVPVLPAKRRRPPLR